MAAEKRITKCYKIVALFITVIILSILPLIRMQSCTNDEGFTMKKDQALAGYVFETLSNIGLFECLLRCMEDIKCLSLNHATGRYPGEGAPSCELNLKNAQTGGNLSCLASRVGTSYIEILNRTDQAHLSCLDYEVLVDENCKSSCKCKPPFGGENCEKIYPKNCKHVQLSGENKDGEYDLYLLWPSSNKTARIYCADMATTTPLEYVTLPAGKENNFARHFNFQTHVKEETSFEKVRVNVTNLSLVKDDYRFATTNVPDLYKEYASASDCKSWNCPAAYRKGTFKVDITGTSFLLPSTIPYKCNAYPTCAAKVFEPNMDANLLRWTGKCGGYCGKCFAEDISLQFV